MDRFSLEQEKQLTQIVGAAQNGGLKRLESKLDGLCDKREMDHDLMMQMESIPRRVAQLETYFMGLGGLEIFGLGLMAVAVRLGWL